MLFRFWSVLDKDIYFLELPATASIDDLSRLLNLDTENINLEQLGIDAIKEQHRINLEFSSDQCTIIPEDRAQVRLVAISDFYTFKCAKYANSKTIAFECALIMLFSLEGSPTVTVLQPPRSSSRKKLRRDALKLVNSTIAGTAMTNLWQLLKSFFGVDEEPEEEELQDAASLTAAIHARKVEQEQKTAAKSLAVTK